MNPARGIVDALVESHYSVDVIPDWKLREAAQQYPCLVVPDWTNIGRQVRDLLLEYARAGGRLLLVGADNALLFREALAVRFLGEASDQRAYVPGAEVFANMRGVWVDVEPMGAFVLETRFPTYDAMRDGKPAATLNAYGDGHIAAIYGPAGSAFAATHAPETRRLVARVLGRIFTPSFTIEGPPVVEAVLRRKGETSLLHLCNAAGMQLASDYGAVDFVPPVGPLRLRLRMPRRPRRVSAEPGGRRLEGSWSDGVWSGVLDRLEIHAIVAWEA